MDFRCAVCKELKDVRTLRNSVCPECRAEQERAAEAMSDHAAGLRYAYEQALKKGPHYTGPLEAWTPREPVLLPDGQHFVCPGCKRRAHLVHDLSIRWNKKPYPIPNKYTLCDVCHRKDVEDGDTPTYTNRFNRAR
ncbi:MAG TPA: hypothetical protein VMA36_07805 [Candidatus Limnocylindria bacterium]|jgi:hypothetical protein|nr:hypothetical protein [Candidatus Limnocylindria bacterium]